MFEIREEIVAGVLLLLSPAAVILVQLVDVAGMQLGDVQTVTDENLIHAGVDKEFHRLRFIREARQLVPVETLESALPEVADRAGSRVDSQETVLRALKQRAGP